MQFLFGLVHISGCNISSTAQEVTSSENRGGHTSMPAYMCAYRYICMYVSLYACMSVRIYIYIYMHLFIYTYMGMYACAYIYHIYIYIYVFVGILPHMVLTL